MADKLFGILAKHAPETVAKIKEQGVAEGEIIEIHRAPIKPKQMELDLREIVPSNEYMTAFTRIPVFKPVKSRKKRLIDPEEGEVIKTSWGRVRRFGAVLNIFDEDTLMGLLHCCRQNEITGRTSQIEGYTGNKNSHSTMVADNEPVITVHYGESTLYQINRYLGRGVGGKDYKNTRESIRRLSRVVFELEYGPEGKALHGNDLLFKLVSREDIGAKEKFKVIFQPIVTQMLAAQLTYVDMNIRMQLTDLGKAVHRFLSSQLSKKKREFKISTFKLYEVVGYCGEYKEFMRSLKNNVVPQLIETGWLRQAIFEDATGNSKGKVLKVAR